MKIRILFCLLFLVHINFSSPVQAIVTYLDSASPTAHQQTFKTVSKKKLFLLKKNEQNESVAYGKIGKILGWVFLGFILLIPIVSFQLRVIMAILGLLSGLFAIIFGLIGLSKAKDDVTAKKARKTFWTILGIVAGVILLSIIISLIILMTVGFA